MRSIRQNSSIWKACKFFIISGLTVILTSLLFAIPIAATSESTLIRLSQTTAFEQESTNDLIANLLYQKPDRSYRAMAISGAIGVNAAWENNQFQQWYIEAQRAGERAIIGGLINNNEAAITAGFKIFDWGFARQAADGSFTGTGDPFHSTSMFLQAVSHALLMIQQSPQSQKYATQVTHYKPIVNRAAHWMITPQVWNNGMRKNEALTHRFYLVGAALGLTGKLTDDRELIDYARQSIEKGLSRQRSDGVNPEKGGHDSNYQMAGVMFVARWITYFPNDSLTPRVIQMINKALIWEETRILPSGEISSEGNTRTAGQERRRNGQIKKVDRWTAIWGFAYWASVTGENKWEAIARKIAQYYYSGL
ncbi:hypothetical protein ACE1CI_31315 [Aerosakkonemataceae cyanobacterium BLCC-F50]|uniref:Uncharacterized protein n=1 Tax=Floridaenema flaviceps BLCC-F50 TaxID=3153642 RepID=A0ABV4Y0B0_9CYAN